MTPVSVDYYIESILATGCFRSWSIARSLVVSDFCSVRVRLLAMFKSELSAVIARLMSKCL